VRDHTSDLNGKDVRLAYESLRLVQNPGITMVMKLLSVQASAGANKY